MNSQKIGSTLGTGLGLTGAIIGSSAWLLLNAYMLHRMGLLIKVAVFDLVAIGGSFLLLHRYSHRAFGIGGTVFLSTIFFLSTEMTLLLAEVPFSQLPWPADMESITKVNSIMQRLLPLPMIMLLMDIMGLGSNLTNRLDKGSGKEWTS